MPYALCTPEYFWFDPESLEFEGFELLRGKYHDLQPNAHGWLWSQQLKLYLGIQDRQLRFFSAQNQLVTPAGAALIAQQQRGAAERRAAAAEQ